MGARAENEQQYNVTQSDPDRQEWWESSPWAELWAVHLVCVLICVERRVTHVRECKWTHDSGKWLCWLAKGLKRERQESREQGVLQKTDFSSEHKMTIIYPRLEYSSLSICPIFFLPFLSLPDVLNLRTQPSNSAAQSLLVGEPTCKHYLNIEIVILFCAVSPVTSSTWYIAGS